MIDAGARRRLRPDRRAVLRGEVPVRVLAPHPLRRRVHVHLHDDLQADLPGQLQHEVEVLEVVLALARLAVAPLHPGAHRVEAQALDRSQVLAPRPLGAGADRLDHRRARLAPAVPDGQREEGLGVGRRRGAEGQEGGQRRGEEGGSGSHQLSVFSREAPAFAGTEARATAITVYSPGGAAEHPSARSAGRVGQPRPRDAILAHRLGRPPLVLVGPAARPGLVLDSRLDARHRRRHPASSGSSPSHRRPGPSRWSGRR